MECNAVSEELKNNNEEKKSKWSIVKMFIGIAIIVAGIIFIAYNNNLVESSNRTPSNNDPFQTVTMLDHDSVVKEKFVAKNGFLSSVAVLFSNQGREATSGEVSVTITDETGKILARTARPVKRIKNRKYTYFSFDEKPILEKDKIYNLTVQCLDAVNDQGFGIFLTTMENQYILDNDIDGNTLEDNIHPRIRYSYTFHDVHTLSLMIGIMLLALLVILIPFKKLSELVNKWTNKNIDFNLLSGRILFVIAPFIAYVIMQFLSEYTFGDTVRSLVTKTAWLNLLIYTIILLILYAITNRIQYSAIILWVISFVFGLTNYFVFGFRGIPVLAADLLSTNTALNVAGSFEFTYDVWAVWAATFLTAASGVMFSLAPQKGLKKKSRIIFAIATVIISICGYFLFIGTDTVTTVFEIEDSQWKPQRTYEKNGSALSFVTSFRYLRTKKPDGYSIDEVKKVTDNKKYSSDAVNKTDAKDKKLPNVIAIMNESLADFSYDGKLKTNVDYLKFIRGLKENTVKGQLFVSIEGANTANSEFEFLTGNSLAFFAPRAIPYNNYVKGIVPSLTRTLKTQGYIGNRSYHPYKRSGWNRENVYQSLGFDYFHSEEYYENPEYVRNFISDKTDMQQIVKDYEAARANSSDPFYLFNVTVQNHGGYVGKRGMVSEDVKSLSDGMNTDDVNQYLTLAKKSDEAFEELVNYFKKVKEPTVIVMFGDHQPPLTNEFYSNLIGKNVNTLNAQEMSNWYSTPYVIWANYDIEENDHMNMSANYLSSYLLKIIGADMTGYNKYLLDVQKKIPIFTGLFYQGDDGVFYNVDQKSKYTDTINQYAKVQYNGLFDKKHREDDFFFLKGANYEVEFPEEETK